MALQRSERVRRNVLVLATLLAMIGFGCDKPIVAESSTATVGGMKMSLGEYELRYLEVSDGENTYEYPQPALVIPITLENVGDGDFTYNPTHATQQMAEAQTPLLYRDPGPEADLPPDSKSLINGVYLQKGSLEGQVTSNTTIGAGESLTDLFLFEVPDESLSNLILSIPPTMHRGKFPVLFRLKYSPKEARGPAVHPVGEPIALQGARFTVTGAEVNFVKTSDTSQGEGFSSDPLLKITYEIENTGSETINYDPSHRSVGGRGASLFGKGDTYKRVKFAPTTSVEGQSEGTTQIEPGKSVTDFVLFDRPPEGAGQLTFEYPAALFNQQGIARVAIDYEYADPPIPEELKKSEKPKDDDSEDSKGG